MTRLTTVSLSIRTSGFQLQVFAPHSCKLVHQHIAKFTIPFRLKVYVRGVQSFLRDNSKVVENSSGQLEFVNLSFLCGQTSFKTLAGSIFYPQQH